MPVSYHARGRSLMMLRRPSPQLLPLGLIICYDPPNVSLASGA